MHPLPNSRTEFKTRYFQKHSVRWIIADLRRIWRCCPSNNRVPFPTWKSKSNQMTRTIHNALRSSAMKSRTRNGRKRGQCYFVVTSISSSIRRPFADANADWMTWINSKIAKLFSSSLRSLKRYVLIHLILFTVQLTLESQYDIS